MTIKIRRDNQVHSIDGGWFQARWHYSFDSYRDPEYTIFGKLRVFNDDRLIPGAVWPMHPHRNVEGLTYVVEGSFGHKDDVGGSFGPLPAGSVQRMTLGSGAMHSELNASQDESMRFIQMWIIPSQLNLAPGVEQRKFTFSDRHNKLLKAISKDGGDAVLVNGDAHISVSALDQGTKLEYEIGNRRGLYFYLISGRLQINGEMLQTGDNAQIVDESNLEIVAQENSEIIFVDTALD